MSLASWACWALRSCSKFLYWPTAAVEQWSLIRNRLSSSGDFGVGGAGGTCYTEGTSASNAYATRTSAETLSPAADYSSEGTKFNPSFPSTCPYATGVGATQIKEGKTIYDSDPEQACFQYIYSAGGFSNVFATPDVNLDLHITWYCADITFLNSTRSRRSQATTPTTRHLTARRSTTTPSRCRPSSVPIRAAQI